MNIEKLRWLQKEILAEPRRYDQRHWIVGKRAPATEAQKPPCGTVACMAGLVVLGHGWKPAYCDEDEQILFEIQKGEEHRYKVQQVAADILELTFEQADRLFAARPKTKISEGWPVVLWNRLLKAKSLEEKAQVAVERIERFIQSNGEE